MTLTTTRSRAAAGTPDTAARARSRRRWPIALLLVLAAAVTHAAAAGSPVAVLLVLTVFGTTAAACWVGWRLGLALTALGGMVVQLLIALAAPHVGWSLATDELVAWSALGVGAVLAIALAPPAALAARQCWDAVCVLAGPAVVGGYLWLAAQRSGPSWIAWGMGNDTANNTILNRELIQQGGLLRSQGNAAPLSTVLHGSWSAPYVDDATSPTEVVRAVLIPGEVLELLVWLAIGVLAAAIALGLTRSSHRGHRLLVGLAAGLIPWGWSMAGYAIAYGFQNAGPAVLILLAAWMCWTGQRVHPVGALTGLILATWAAATAWGPTAIFPALWLVACLWTARRELLAARWRLAVPAVALVAAATYALRFTLADLTAAGGVLALDGAHPNYSWHWGLGIAIGIVVLALACWRWAAPPVRAGALIAVVAGALGVTSLLRQRAGLPELWGYYPIKFTWLSIAAAVCIGFAVLQAPISRVAHRLWRGSGVLLTFLLLGWLLFHTTPPWRPSTVASVATPVALHDNVRQDAEVAEMFAMMEQNPRNIVARYFPGGPVEDSFVNFWMLQMAADSTSDPLRQIAYTMNAADPVSLCAGIAAWQGGEPVVVWTRDHKLRKELKKTCPPGLDYRLEVRPGPPAP